MTILTNGSPEEAGFDPKRIELLRQRVPEWVDGKRMRSGVLLAARRGTIVFHEAYGPLTDQADSPAMVKDTIFSVASITKTVTATAAMILVERGQLGLNRPIKEYLPEVCGEGTEDIEVQHLFTHTSGQCQPVSVCCSCDDGKDVLYAKTLSQEYQLDKKSCHFSSKINFNEDRDRRRVPDF